MTDVAPPVGNGNLWFDTAPTDLQLYVGYNDGTSTQWVPATPVAGGGSGGGGSGGGGTVVSISAGPGLSGGTITTSGTIALATRAAGRLMGNPGTIAAVPSDIVVGSGLTLSSGGTLSSTAGGGSVTSVATTGPGITGGPITGAGTLAVQWNAGSVTALGANLTLATGTLSATGTGGGAVVVAPIHSTAMEAGHVFKNSAGTCYFVDCVNGTSTQGLLVILDAAVMPGDGAITGSAVIDAIPLPPLGRATYSPAGAAAACSNGILAYVSTNTATPFTKATSGVSAYFTGLVT